jgi:SpoVK/Ycf46/Vps4 family AAA+-type ATPase
MPNRHRHPLFKRPETTVGPSRPLREQPAEVQRWTLRLILQHARWRTQLWSTLTTDSSLRRALGLKGKIPETPAARSRWETRWHQELVALDCPTETRIELPPVLDDNTKKLADVLGLSDLERKTLCLLVLLERDAILGRLARTTEELSNEAAFEVMGQLLDIPPDRATSLFSRKGRLQSIGLIRVDQNPRRISDKFDCISSSLATDLLTPNVNIPLLFRDLFRPAPPTDLGWNDFDHLGRQGELLRELLRSRSTGTSPAANVLLSGMPGVGKTMLARLLASHLSLEAYEIAVEDEDGDSIDGEKRLRALLAAREIFQGRRALLIFDELEDVCPPPSLLGPRGVGAARKGWLNRILDDTSVSTIFITNRPDALDPAYVRRMDLVLEIPCPPRESRRALVQRVAPTISLDLVGRLLESPSTTPAIICRAAQTAEAMRASLPPGASLDPYIEIAVDGTLKAQGHRSLKATNAGLPGFYRPAYVNADQNLDDLAEGLIRNGAGRLLLYGQPGTGKSAFARHLAERLNRPLILNRGSDLLDPFVGMTEQKIAAAFEEAIQESAVLVFDEVDSFLTNRQRAFRSWEVTRTNEFLTQLENFEGLVVATTNLVADLDPAALRRFDLKSAFGFMQPQQARALLAEHLAAQKLSPPDEDTLRELDKTDRLTPGDFAAVARRARFQAILTAGAWLTALAEEVRLKTPERRSVGFHAAGTLLPSPHP